MSAADRLSPAPPDADIVRTELDVQHAVKIQLAGAKLGAEKKSSARRDEDLPTVEEECPSCGNSVAYYRTMQLRSADEGQTIFYTCTNPQCGWKWKQDS